MYRLGRLCFGPVVGVVAALLVLSRFFLENLAAQGYLDISYVALIVWAVVLEVERPRRGDAGARACSRPPACCAPTRGCSAAPTGCGASWPTKANRIANATRVRYAAIAAVAPVLWVLVDLIVTGNPLYSLNSTAGLAQELGRTQGLASVVGSIWHVRRAHRQAAGADRRDRRPRARDLADAATRAHAARGARAAARRVRARGRRRRVGDRPLPARRGRHAAAVLRRRGRRLVDAASRARRCGACGWPARRCSSSTASSRRRRR